MKRILHIVLVLVAVAACQGPRVIPKGTLTDIYEEMFITDQQVRERNIPRNQMDTMLVYEAIFNKYGYNTDDYLYSVRHYLKDPERFAKVFEEVAKRLDGEVKNLDKIIENEQRLAEKKAQRYPLVDSLLAPFSKEAAYMGLTRIERDTSRYAAWIRLVPVQEDTLMIPVDSLPVRMARKARLDSLAAVRDSLAAAKDSLAVAKDSLKAEKPVVAPTEKLRPHRLPNRALDLEPVQEEVAEEEAVAE